MHVALEQLPVLGTNGFPLQDSAVYGPIHSRRFGYSLGINPLPVTYKFCDFDCVYCQYGWTPRNGNSAAKTAEKLKPVQNLLSEIETYFRKFVHHNTQIDVITIAGNGEPTLYPDFLRLVQGILEFRNYYYPKTRVGILSDSSQCHRIEIKQALEMLDDRCMKLDAGDPQTIQEVNRPVGGFNLERTLHALRDLKDITIQAMFVQGSYNNTKPEQIDEWIKGIQFVKPTSVQVYTIDRPPADGKIEAVPAERLNEIAQLCQNKTGILTEVFD